MCALERGLARGLGSLFGEGSSGKEHSRLPIASLKANSSQPRMHFHEESLNELAESIRAQGILQPILVRPVQDAMPQEYEIVAGERRWRAAQIAGLTEVPVLIRDLSDDDILPIALIENLQREDLNALEEAQGIDKLRQALQLSQDDLAKRLGKSRSAIANALRLLQLPEAMLRSLDEGLISAGHARALLAIAEPGPQAALHEAMLRRDVSVRAAEDAVTYWKRHKTLPEGLSAEPPQAAPAAPASPAMPGLRLTRTKPAFIQALQKQLRARLHPKTTLHGTQDMGRITMPYESAAQLRDLLAQLGINPHDLPDAGEASDAQA